MQHSWSILWAIPTPVTPHSAPLQTRQKPRRAAPCRARCTPGEAGLLWALQPQGWEDAPCRRLRHSRPCPAPFLQLIWGVGRSSLCRGPPRCGAGWHPGPSPPPRRLWPRAGLGRAASAHGSARCQCRGVPEVGWDQHVPAKRVGRGWSVSWPATPTPSHPHGASLRSSSVPLHAPARNPAPALPARLQVWGKALAGARPLREPGPGHTLHHRGKMPRFGDNIRSANRSQSNLG